MIKKLSLIFSIILSAAFFSKAQALTYSIKPVEQDESGVQVQNSANIDASNTDIGVRKSGNKFRIKARVPKRQGVRVSIKARVDEEFTQFVKISNKVFTARKKRFSVNFIIRVKRSINSIIPDGAIIGVPIILTDLASGAEESFTLEIRD